MPATKTQKQKTSHEPVFPYRTAFEVFLEEVEYAAQGAEVKPDNIKLILEFLKEKFGKGIPDEAL